MQRGRKKPGQKCRVEKGCGQESVPQPENTVQALPGTDRRQHTYKKLTRDHNIKETQVEL